MATKETNSEFPLTPKFEKHKQIFKVLNVKNKSVIILSSADVKR